MIPAFTLAPLASALSLDVKLPQRDMMVCTTEYMPICGIDPETGEKREYSNKCVLFAHGATPCNVSDLIPGGVVQSGSLIDQGTDQNGCLRSAGYSYDVFLRECIRLTESQDLYRWAAKVGLTTTKNVEGFHADATITRDEAAAILSRALEKGLIHLSIPQTLRRTEFTDMHVISPEFRNAVQHMHNTMIMRGNADGAFVPKAQLTSYEGLVMLARILALPEVTNAHEAHALTKKLGLTLDAGSLFSRMTRKDFFSFLYMAIEKQATPGSFRDIENTAADKTAVEGKWKLE